MSKRRKLFIAPAESIFLDPEVDLEPPRKAGKRPRRKTPLQRFREQALSRKRILQLQQRKCAKELKTIIKDLGKLKRRR